MGGVAATLPKGRSPAPGSPALPAQKPPTRRIPPFLTQATDRVCPYGRSFHTCLLSVTQQPVRALLPASSLRPRLPLATQLQTKAQQTALALFHSFPRSPRPQNKVQTHTPLPPLCFLESEMLIIFHFLTLLRSKCTLSGSRVRPCACLCTQSDHRVRGVPGRLRTEDAQEERTPSAPARTPAALKHTENTTPVRLGSSGPQPAVPYSRFSADRIPPIP